MRVRAIRTYRRARGHGLATPPGVYDEPDHVAERAIEGGYAEPVGDAKAQRLAETHTKKELYSMAQDLDIAGRSDMDESELALAIAEVS